MTNREIEPEARVPPPCDARSDGAVVVEQKKNVSAWDRGHADIDPRASKRDILKHARKRASRRANLRRHMRRPATVIPRPRPGGSAQCSEVAGPFGAQFVPLVPPPILHK